MMMAGHLSVAMHTFSILLLYTCMQFLQMHFLAAPNITRNSLRNSSTQYVYEKKKNTIKLYIIKVKSFNEKKISVSWFCSNVFHKCENIYLILYLLSECNNNIEWNEQLDGNGNEPKTMRPRINAALDGWNREPMTRKARKAPKINKKKWIYLPFRHTWTSLNYFSMW